MNSDLIIAICVSLLLHAGLALSGTFFKEAPGPQLAVEAVPTIALDLPPPPEPEEPEVLENTVADAPPEVADLAPPMQNDLPSAVIDAPFVQQIQAPPPPGLNRSTNSIVIPASTRPSVTAGKGLGNIFDLAALDQPLEVRVLINPIYPYEMRKSGLKGEVVISFIVDSHGDVRDPTILRSSNPNFEDAAIQAVLKWKFKPGKKGGVAVSTRVTQPITFSLNAE